MTLAWEILECARVVFSNQKPTLKSQLSLASVYARLGEQAIETERLDDALNDFQQCYKIRLQNLPPYDRSIAEILFSMSLAYQSGGRFSDAISCLNEALSIIHKKLHWLRSGTALQDSLDGSSTSSTSSSSSSSSSTAIEAANIMSPPLTTQQQVDDEIKDLELLIPDINSRVSFYFCNLKKKKK